MEQFLNSLPKPVLAIGAIIIGIIVFMLIEPPHTVCDTQGEALKENLKGVLFSTEVKKNKIPPALVRAKETCQQGNSAGSCYEYFTILKKVSDEVGKGSSECTGQLYKIPEVQSALTNGLELMVRMAWGHEPPEKGFARFGWMQEAELSTYCRVSGVFVRANGEQAWADFRTRIYGKLPGESLTVGADGAAIGAEPKKANIVFSEQELWERSLFSIRCETFL